MGGGGGGTHYVEDGSLYFIMTDDPFATWHARVDWSDGGWVVVEWKVPARVKNEHSGTLVEAYLCGFFFEDPNVYDWEPDPAGGYRRRGTG